MQKILAIIILTMCYRFCLGQIVSSSCYAADSIMQKYNADADRLALRKIYQYNLAYKDSVEIPQVHTDTILKALLAVYNATALSARDTVVDMYSIHTLHIPGLNSVLVSADTSLPWMQQLKNGITPTGNTIIDSLSNLYYLHFKSYTQYIGVTAIVVFETDSNYNIQALADLYETIPGVFLAEQNELALDGDDITATIYPNYVELIYLHGWEDCWNGCIARRYWKFKIYYNCDVEFVSSYGSPLPAIAIKEYSKLQKIEIYPNPTYGNVFAKIYSENNKNIVVTIFDLQGRKVSSNFFGNYTQDNFTLKIPTQHLQAGVYFVTVSSNDKIFKTKKLVIR